MQEGSRKAVVAAFLANVAIAVSKFTAFAFTGSTALLAEAVHSVADTANQALLFLGGRRAQRAATAEHPFGHGRERYFWTFVVAVVLFTLGGAFAVAEGVDKLFHPHKPQSIAWALGVLSFAAVMESLSLRTATREASAERAGAPWREFIRRSKSPELPAVVLEDVGGLIGLGIAFAGVVLAEITGNARYDAAGSLAIGALLCFLAMVLAVEMKSLLIGEAANPADTTAIAAAMTTHPRVTRLIHLRTEHLGPDELLVAAKLEFDRSLSFVELAETIDDVERTVRERVPSARVMYIEPDYFRQ